MKKLTFFIIAAFYLLLNAQTQQASIEERMFGVQAGFFGIWGNYEKKLSNTTTLKTEIGLDYGLWLEANEYLGYFFAPALIVEPRYYYSLQKRQAKSKRIDGNSSNYISLFLRHHPDWFVISNYNLGSVVPDLSVIPTWGIHRRIGKNFNFDTSVGLGYRFYFINNNEVSSNYGELDFNITLRIGYEF
ncbi:MAG: hypothetical protein IPM71_16425 [Bacteroidota bacterium]|nr:MAG: hypothetical protein IPM71_16425 [Bacteroidota bacterium]